MVKGLHFARHTETLVWGLRAFPASRLGGGLGENAVSSNTKLPGQGVGPSYLGWPEGEAGPSASPGNLTSALQCPLQYPLQCFFCPIKK
ncbi:unnamed protein product [Prunus armeniaca]